MKKIFSFLCSLAFLFSSQRDLKILLAEDALTRGDFPLVRDTYLELYKQTKDILFTRQIAIAYAALGDLSNALHYALLYQNTTKDTKDIPTSKIIADRYIRSGDIQKAISRLEDIRSQESSPDVDNILGTLYLNQKQFNKALKLLISYYDYAKDEETLKKILAIYFSKNKNQEAVALLEEYIEEKGCSPSLCFRAVDIFHQLNYNDTAYAIFSNFYKEKPSLETASYYLKVLINLKRFKQAEEITKKYSIDGELLLDLYVAQNRYEDASGEAQKIYKKNNDPKYLAWSAIYTYQAHPSISPSLLSSVIDGLSKAIKDRDTELKMHNEDPNNEDAFFYNFLGYILVEHNVDVKQGISLIKKALSIAPNSLTYIDSLAWGYYKLGDCAQAQSVFSTIPKSHLKNDPSLLDHFQMIGQCR